MARLLTDMNSTWYRYTIDLGRTVRLGPHEARTRSGFILRIENGGPRLGARSGAQSGARSGARFSAGEAAPIDGYGSDTMAQVRAALADATDRLSVGSVPETVDELEDWTATHGSDWPATVRFAAESALMYLAAEAAGVSPADWMGGLRRPVIDVCGLADADAGVAREASGPGSVVKIKVGRSDPVREGGVAAALTAAGGAIRCDANRAWSGEEAGEFLRAFQDAGGRVDRFEFLEEPLRDPIGLTDFAEESPVPIALDESILEAGPEFDPVAWPGVDFFVLKPSLFGGLTDTIKLAQRVRGSGGEVVISSAFESGLGLVTAAWLASTIDGPAAGFGTAPFVLCNEVPLPDDFPGTTISVAKLPSNPAETIRFDHLEAIDD